MNWTVLKNTHKADPSFEEGWTLLPDGTVLTVDIANGTQSETFEPATNTWTPAGSTVVPLVSGNEIGGGVLRPDGTVFVTGETGHTSIYDYRTRTWSAGPDFPVLGGTQLNAGDWPGALLPNGNVLVSATTRLSGCPASLAARPWHRCGVYVFEDIVATIYPSGLCRVVEES